MNPLAFGAANHVTDTITDNAAITMALNNIANAATNNSNLIAALNESVKALEMQARQQRQPPLLALPQ
jgi:septal ring factor EnvC (AmiA/AmiB activator)